jgi:hypothetical protein
MGLIKMTFYGLIGFGTIMFVTPPILRFIFRWEDKNTNEYEQKRIRLWLEEMKDKPVIKNSEGENFF